MHEFKYFYYSFKMFSWAFEVGAPEVCVRLLMDFYGLSQDQVWCFDVLICEGSLIYYC